MMGKDGTKITNECGGSREIVPRLERSCSVSNALVLPIMRSDSPRQGRLDIFLYIPFEVPFDPDSSYDACQPAA